MRKYRKATPEARDQYGIKKAVKGITLIYVGTIDRYHDSGDDKFEGDKYVEYYDVDDNVQLLFKMMD